MAELKRVSFKVAKALKEAGYPQDIQEVYKENGEYFVSYIKYSNTFAAPTYLDVWLWLWRDKNIKMDFTTKFDLVKGYYRIVAIFGDNETFIIEADGDPEEAIEQAIEHLVENNLIK